MPAEVWRDVGAVGGLDDEARLRMAVAARGAGV
jgi:hypothetical protein